MINLMVHIITTKILKVKPVLMAERSRTYASGTEAGIVQVL
jgi:hypothetical protein